jgi:hypothetical protein
MCKEELLERRGAEAPWETTKDEPPAAPLKGAKARHEAVRRKKKVKSDFRLIMVFPFVELFELNDLWRDKRKDNR